MPLRDPWLPSVLRRLSPPGWLLAPARLSATARARLAVVGPAGAAPAARPRAAAACLSHHEILSVTAPFVRRGIRPELGSTDRMAGRIAFAPVEWPQDATMPSLRQTMRLDRVGAHRWRLVRDTWHPDGRCASLQADGPDPGALLDRIASIHPAIHFVASGDALLSLGHRVDPDSDAPPVPNRLEARLPGLVMSMTAPSAPGVSARIDLHRAPSGSPALPDDVLAVLGWDWSFLRTDPRGWYASVRLHGRGAARAAQASRRFREAAAHLARSLAEPPGAYHLRLRASRWRAALRRAVPTLVWAGLLADAAAAPLLRDGGAWPLLAITAPPVLLLFFVCRSQEARFERPRLPRPPSAHAWQAPT